MNDRIKNFLYFAFGLVAIGGAIGYIFDMPNSVYVYGTGAIGLITFRILTLKNSTNFRIRRLHAILAISSLLMLATAYLMYIQNNAWAITLILAALFDLLVSLRTPKEKI